MILGVLIEREREVIWEILKERERYFAGSSMRGRGDLRGLQWEGERGKYLPKYYELRERERVHNEREREGERQRQREGGYQNERGGRWVPQHRSNLHFQFSFPDRLPTWHYVTWVVFKWHSSETFQITNKIKLNLYHRALYNWRKFLHYIIPPF